LQFKINTIVIMRVFLLVLFTCILFNTHSQNINNIPSQKPKLVIAIMIDQMRYDLIYKYWDNYTNNGFRRMLSEGTFCKNARYHNVVTAPMVSYATFVTGANPSHHGIVSNDWYQVLTSKVVHCTADSTVSTIGGSYESGRYSPRRLLSTSFSDELRIHNNKKSKVFSISIDPSNAVLGGGLMANAAYWMDFESGSFVTSSFYQDTVSTWVADFNKKKLGDSYLDRLWETILPMDKYGDSIKDLVSYETGFNGQAVFPYDLNKLSLVKGKRNYQLLQSVPFGNNLMKDFAISTIVNEQLGKDEVTDFLMLGFSATNQISKLFGLNSVEMQDAYLRLDREIEHLLNFIDSYLGKGNVLVVLTSSQGCSYSPQFMNEIGISMGYFNSTASIALLKSYLNVTYGKGDWVSHYNNLNIYLNQKLISDSKISRSVFEKDVSDILLQFAGVNTVLTSTSLINSSYSDGIFKKIQNSYHQKRSGDIIINLEPGWIEKKGLDIYYNSLYNNETHVPLIWYGWKIKRSIISREIGITDVAPTLSIFLDVAIPNACQGSAIKELIE